MEKEKPEEVQPPPPPPEDVTDSDQIAAGEERWQACPLNDCKRNNDLLYEDFYLRGIRTNRLMCSACAVRMEVGYVAREIAKAQDDKFFTGTRMDYVIVFFTTLLMSFAVNTALLLLDYWFVGVVLGFGAGWLISIVAKRLTKGRLGRHSPKIAIAGVISGFIGSPPVLFMSYLMISLILVIPGSGYPAGEMPISGFFVLFLFALLPQIACTAVMVYLVRNIFRR